MKSFSEWLAEGVVANAIGAIVAKPIHDIKVMKDYLNGTFVEDDKGNRYNVPKNGLKQGYQWYYNPITKRVEQKKIEDDKNLQNDNKTANRTY